MLNIHLQHLNMPADYLIPGVYEEMTCFKCVEKYPFMLLQALSNKEEPITSKFLESGLKGRIHDDEEPDVKRPKTTDGVCTVIQTAKEQGLGKIDFRQQGTNFFSGVLPSVFWSVNWRELICQCEDCKVSLLYLPLPNLLILLSESCSILRRFISLLWKLTGYKNND